MPSTDWKTINPSASPEEAEQFIRILLVIVARVNEDAEGFLDIMKQRKAPSPEHFHNSLKELLTSAAGLTGFVETARQNMEGTKH